MNKDLKILLRLQEIYESKLLLFSKDFECSTARNCYYHEFGETKDILNLINRLIDEKERMEQI